MKKMIDVKKTENFENDPKLDDLHDSFSACCVHGQSL